MSEAGDKTTIRHPAGSDFEPLAASLEGWFEKSLSELPTELRQLVDKHFSLIPWDNLSPAQRRAVVAQFSWYNDLANEYEQDFWLTLFSRRIGLDDEKRVGTNATNRGDQKLELKRINRELDEIKKIEDYVTSIAPNKQRAAMERFLAHWDECDSPPGDLEALISQLEGIASVVR
jgi:hypothetical protein